MSMSNFSQEWPSDPSQGIEAHKAMIQSGLDQIHAQLILPEDGRLDIAYGMLSMGGLEAAVLNTGTAGGGKSAWGNGVAGEQNRVDIEATDTEETLFGYPNPIDGDKFIPGKFTLDPENPIIFANEISHLRNTGPLHRIWDGNQLEVNDEQIPMGNAVIYATSNFPNGNRVHELDDAMRSRFAAEVITGDLPESFAEELHGRDLRQTSTSAIREGLLPNAAAREALREQAMHLMPLERNFGRFVTRMVSGVNEAPLDGQRLFVPVSITDARLSRGWQQAARARQLVEADIRHIDVEAAAKVASMVLPTMVRLSHTAKAELASRMGIVAKLDPLVEAVVTRRLVSTMAFDAWQALKDDTMSGRDYDSKRTQFRNNYSYASTNGHSDVIDGFVEDVLSPKQQEKSNNEQPKRRIFGSRRDRS